MLEPRKPIQYFQIDSAETKTIDSHTIVETPVSLTVNGEAVGFVHVHARPARSDGGWLPLQ